MGISASAPFSARRYERRQLIIRFVGMDLTGKALHGQIRLAQDTPSVLVDLPLTTSASTEGVRLVGVQLEANITVSTVAIQLATETMSDPARMPYSGEIGDDSLFAWGLKVDGIQRVGGAFWALAGVVDADSAVPNRPEGYGAGRRGPGLAETIGLTFGDDRIDIVIDGVAYLEPLTLRTEAAAARVEQFAAIVDNVDARISAVSADRVAGDAALGQAVAANGARIEAISEARVQGDQASYDRDVNLQLGINNAQDRITQVAERGEAIARDRVAGDAGLAQTAAIDRQAIAAVAADLTTEVAGRRTAVTAVRGDLSALSRRVDRIVAPPDGPADIDFDRVSEQAFGDRTVITGDGTSRPLRVWIEGAPLTCDFEVETARAQPGFAGDDAVAMNALADRYQGFRLTPAIGSRIITKTPVEMRNNAVLEFAGGLQTLSWERALDFVGVPTLKLGSSTISAGRFRLVDAYFVMKHRAGGGIDAYVEGQALPGLLTGGETHLEIHDGTSAYARIGGYGAPYMVTTYGGSGIIFDGPDFYGSIYDEAVAGAQEGIAHFRWASSPTWGHSRSHSVMNGKMYGGARTGRRKVTVGAKEVFVSRRIGPKFASVGEGFEDIEFIGGITAGYSHSNFAFLVPAGGIAQNFRVSEHHVDESNHSGLWAPVDCAPVDTVRFADCIFNGQQIGVHAIDIESNGTSRPIRELEVLDCQLRSYLGGAVRLSGVDGGRLSRLRLRGYNKAVNDYRVAGETIGAGVLAFGGTRNLLLDDIIYGGGDNSDDEDAALDATSKMAANATQIGLCGLPSAGANITYRHQRSRSFGLPGGGTVLGNATLDDQP